MTIQLYMGWEALVRQNPIRDASLFPEQQRLSINFLVDHGDDISGIQVFTPRDKMSVLVDGPFADLSQLPEYSKSLREDLILNLQNAVSQGLLTVVKEPSPLVWYYHHSDYEDSESL